MLRENQAMKDINLLFEYQKFSPNSRLGSKIDEVNSRFLSPGSELRDDDLDVSAAGEPGMEGRELNANRK